jgi:hypothetical protein
MLPFQANGIFGIVFIYKLELTAKSSGFSLVFLFFRFLDLRRAIFSGRMEKPTGAGKRIQYE